jgi:hypothetical protein
MHSSDESQQRNEAEKTEVMMVVYSNVVKMRIIPNEG